LQLIDSLNAGGAERMAVNLANALTEGVERSYLCSTRAEGLLKTSVHPEVSYLFLKKRSALDLFAFYRFYKFVRAERISIIHAHSTSFFLGTLVRLICPKIKLVWHDHYGNSAFLKERPKRILNWCSKRFSHIFCVNSALEQWAKEHLQCKSVSYLQNFVVPNIRASKETTLQGVAGQRILCLANLRPQKDHITLLEAFARLYEKHPEWSLHCVGRDFKDACSQKLYEKVKALQLERAVFFYGSRPDTSTIIKQCTIGVLASKSEGLPLALLEYGLGGLATVATDVGDCNLVIQSQEEGLLVRAQDATLLAAALGFYIEQPQLRQQAAERLQVQVLRRFSEAAVINELLKSYGSLKN
jgi:glycosyltransferase involved in cell wall biosynthesis